MEEAISMFEYRCRSYNLYRYLYYSRIILPTHELVVKRLEQFENLQIIMVEKIDEMNFAIRNVNSLFETFNSSAGVRLDEVAQLTYRYLLDPSVRKHKIAEVMTTKEIGADLVAFETMCADLRARSLTVLDIWMELNEAILDIWNSMLNENWTKQFYGTIRRDIMEYNKTGDDELRKSFEYILDRSVQDIPTEDLLKTTNADLVNVSTSDMLDTKKLLFADAVEKYSVINIIGNKPDHFVKAFEKLQKHLSTYLKSTAINTEFFRWVT
jgi:hypothetical protein